MRTNYPLSLSMLKLLEIRRKKMSLRRKRFNISFAPAQFIEELMQIYKSAIQDLEGADIHSYVVQYNNSLFSNPPKHDIITNIVFLFYRKSCTIRLSRGIIILSKGAVHETPQPSVAPGFCRRHEP